MNVWLARALSLLRIDGKQLKWYEALRLNNSHSRFEHQFEYKSDAYCFFIYFDFLSTNDPSLDIVDGTSKIIRLQ